MSVDVVKSLHYDSLWGHDGTWCDSVGSWATVPEMSDLYERASKTELNNLKKEIKEDIKDCNELAQKKIDSLSSVLTNKFESLKNVILSNERLEQEVQILRNVEKEIIEHIASEYSVHQESIRKEIESFQQMDLSTELQDVLTPLDTKLQAIMKSNKELMGRIVSIEKLDKELIEYKVILANIQKERTVCENLLNKLSIEQENILVQCENLISDKFKSLYQKFIAFAVMLIGIISLILMYYMTIN